MTMASETKLKLSPDIKNSSWPPSKGGKWSGLASDSRNSLCKTICRTPSTVGERGEDHREAEQMTSDLDSSVRAGDRGRKQTGLEKTVPTSSCRGSLDIM